mmetsp:Transcript_132668/g.369863  ORF Transcript_132668/g.369863 Transcript_132668/m.369863 type:complete len:500 (-) Transcript_132668:23-1522(-)
MPASPSYCSAELVVVGAVVAIVLRVIFLLRLIHLLRRALRPLLSCLLLPLGQDLQIAVVAESGNVADDGAPDDVNVGGLGEVVHPQERKQQREEDKGGLVEVATEGSGGGGERVDDGELDDVVRKGEDAGEEQPGHGGWAHTPRAHEDFEVGHLLHPKDLGPLSGHRLLEEVGNRCEEECGGDRHVGHGVVHVQLRVPEDARERQVHGAAEEGGDAHHDAQDHVLALLRFSPGHDLGPREQASAEHANDHQRHLQHFARLLLVEIAHGEPLLGEEGRQRQARADDEVHCDADVPETEVVQGNIEGKDATKDDHAHDLEGTVQLLWHVAVGREVHRRKEDQKDDEGYHLLEGSQRKPCRAAREILLKRVAPHYGVLCHRDVRAHDPAHVDVHEGLRPKVQHQLAHGCDLLIGHHPCSNDEAQDGDDEWFEGVLNLVDVHHGVHGRQARVMRVDLLRPADMLDGGVRHGAGETASGAGSGWGAGAWACHLVLRPEPDDRGA